MKTDWPVVDVHHHVGVSTTCTFIAEEVLIPWMDDGEIDIQVVFQVNQHACHRTPDWNPYLGNDYIAKIQRMFSDRVIGLARIDPWQQPPARYSYPPSLRGKPFDRLTRNPTIEECHRAILELGLWGVKMHPKEHGFPVNHSSVRTILKELVKIQEEAGRKLMILVHAAADSTYNTNEGLADVAKDFPELIFLMAHCGFPWGGKLFDRHNVSFVSVTQHFNTTTSMGRLTLNVLLSFAQFEREVTSERIRDKIGASKRKGLWVGGMAPLGYDTKDRKISVNEAEAERVRIVFRRYLELGSLDLVMANLRRDGIVTKVRKLKTGKTMGGIPFTRGSLAHLLRNSFYIGEVHFKGEILKGEQPAIVDKKLFDAVQAKLNEQVNNHKATRITSEALLAGRIFDDGGNRMTPSHARKAGRKYRYYLSAALLQAQPELVGSVARIPAIEIESLVTRAVRESLKPSAQTNDRSLIDEHVARVEIHAEQVVIQLAQDDEKDRAPRADHTLRVPWRKAAQKRHREVLVPSDSSARSARPIRSETRATLVTSIARGRLWLDELTSDSTTTTQAIAKREGCSLRKVNMTISLAFLAPRLVKAAIEGKLPHGMGVSRLIDLPAEWSRQHQMLGLPGQ